MPRPSFSNVRLTIYVQPETAARIRALAGRGPLGHPVDYAFAALEMPVSKPFAGPPRLVKKPTAYADRKHSMANCLVPPVVVGQDVTRTVTHPIACQCEACTLARLQSPQIRKAK